MIAVLDSNCFHDDARAKRPKLQSVLDAVTKEAIGLVVPEVVLDELEKQFRRRSKRVYKEIRAYGSELGALGIPFMNFPDVEAEAASYRSALESVLTASGARIAPYPEDLRPAVPWAVLRRKPFDEGGSGFPDAVIWLTVLQIAKENNGEEIVLVTDDKDFAVSKADPQLADDLRSDLVNPDHVRRVAGIDAFVEELGERLEASRDRAQELIDEHAFDSDIESKVIYSEVEQAPLRLGVDLDNDPTIIGWDLEALRIIGAVTLPGGGIRLEAVAQGAALLSLLIYRADYHLAMEANYVPFTVSNADWNRHYVEAESELTLELSLAITANDDGTDAQIDLLGVALAPIELAARELAEESGDFVDQLRPMLIGLKVEEFIPDVPVEGDVESATIEAAYSEDSLRVGEIFSDPGDDELSVEVRLSAEADVTWLVSAPTSADAERFGGLAENQESGAPFLHDLESGVPLEIQVSASWDNESGWHDLDVTRVALGTKEAKVRASRPTASEEAETNRLIEMVEAEEEKQEREDEKKKRKDEQ